MTEIDNRIVSINFDNQEFERNIGETLESLSRLSDSIQLIGEQEGFTALAEKTDSFNLDSMESAIETISDKFSVLGAIGFSVIQDLTQSALNFGRSVSAKVLDPLIVGGKSRATNIENAKFQFRGLGIDVEAAMASALKAVKGTAFGLDEAAKAAAIFGASGIEAGDEMTTALRGISGAAAITNTSFGEIADIFTSAAGAGKVNGADLARFATRGLNAAAALGKQLNLTEAEVRQMASAGELSFDVFAQAMDDAFGEHATKANETYTGSLANMRAALSRIGASFFGPRQEQLKDFFNALTPVIDKVAEALEPMIELLLRITGNSTDKLIAFLEGLDLSNFTDAMALVAEGLGNIYDFLSEIVSIGASVFRDIFPASESSKILTFAEAFKNFTEQLKIGGKVAENIKSIFRGVFSIFAIGIEVVKEVVKIFAGLFGFAFESTGGGLLSFVAGLGDSLTLLKEALVDGGGIQKFFEGLVKAIKNPIETLKSLFDGKGFPGAEILEGILERLGARFDNLSSASGRAGDAWRSLMERFEGVRHILGAIWEYISTWFSELGEKLAAVMTPADFDNAVDIVNIGLLGGIAALIRKFLNEGLSIDLSGGIFGQIEGIFESLTDTLAAMQTEIKARALLKIASAVAVLTASVVVLSLIDSAALTKALAALTVGFGQLIGAMTLLDKIDFASSPLKLTGLGVAMIFLGVAIGILTIAVKRLSKLEWDELAKGLLGVTVLLGALSGATQLMSKDASGMIRSGAALIGIAIALLILSQAVKAFSDMSWEEMAKGLIGVGVGLGLLTTALKFMPSGMIAMGIGLIGVATALLILAKAVEAFAQMSLEDMAKGFVGIGGGLTLIAAAMHIMPPNMVLTAAGLIVVGAALNIIAKAVGTLGEMGLGELAKGIGAIGVMLGILAVGTTAMSATAGGAGALLVVSGALLILSKVLKNLGQLSIAQIATGLTTIAIALGILGAAAYLLAPLLPALYGLGIALGLIGASFALFGLGAALVAKAFETMAKAGRTGVRVLVDVIDEFIKALPRFVGTFIEAIGEIVVGILELAPTIVKAIRVIVGHILDTVIELAPKLSETITTILTEVLNIIRELYPEFQKTAFELILHFLNGFSENIGDIVSTATELILNFAGALLGNVAPLVEAGVKLILKFLEALSLRAADITAAGLKLLVSFIDGITNNLATVTEAVANLIVTFLTEIANSIEEITAAGIKILEALLKGISDTIETVVTMVGEIITTFLTALGNKAQDIIDAGFQILTDLLTGIGDNIEDITATISKVVTKIVSALGDALTDFLDAGAQVLADILQGIEDSIETVVPKATAVVTKFIDAVGDAALTLAAAGGQALVDFLDGLADEIEVRAPEIRRAGRRVAAAIIEGVTGGLVSKESAAKVAKSVLRVAKDAIGLMKSVLGISSPSKVFAEIGRYMAEGLAVGLDEDKTARRGVRSFANNIKKQLTESLTKVSDDLSTIDEFNPTITPVLDLTRVEAAAGGLNKALDISTITPDVSYTQAQTISKTSEIAKSSPEETKSTAPTEVTFEQNIYAPRALSTNDIYRNTKSQIALAKEELSIA